MLKIFIFFSVLLFLIPVNAQLIPQISDIPDNFTPQQKELFTRKKAHLIGQKDSLKSKTAQFNIKCGNVPELNTSLINQCESDQSQIKKEKKKLIDAINEFNNDILSIEAKEEEKAKTGNKLKENSPIGVASKIVGTVKVLRDGGKEWIIKPGIALRAGDRIITGADSKFQVILLDETSFTMGANSDMVLDEFVYDPNTSIGKISCLVMKGFFRFITSKVARRDPASMKVTTPVGYIGIRGTDFQLKVLPDSSGSIYLYNGLLQITEKKTKKIVQMVAGQMLVFSSSGKCSNPVMFNEQMKKESQEL